MRKKKYIVRPPSSKVLKKYWLALESAEDQFYGRVQGIEKAMQLETGIKDIEFFMSPDDGSYCGIGNASRTMKLINRDYGIMGDFVKEAHL